MHKQIMFYRNELSSTKAANDTNKRLEPFFNNVWRDVNLMLIVSWFYEFPCCAALADDGLEASLNAHVCTAANTATEAVLTSNALWGNTATYYRNTNT